MLGEGGGGKGRPCAKMLPRNSHILLSCSVNFPIPTPFISITKMLL